MANKQAGEVDLKVDGKTFTLCLTLGALAAMEDRLGVVTPGELDEIIQRPTYRQLLEMTHCLINFRATDGEELMSRRELELSDLRWQGAFYGIVEAITSASPKDAEGNGEREGAKAT